MQDIRRCNENPKVNCTLNHSTGNDIANTKNNKAFFCSSTTTLGSDTRYKCNSNDNDSNDIIDVNNSILLSDKQ